MADENLKSARVLAAKYHEMLKAAVAEQERIRELLDKACDRDDEVRRLIAASDMDGLRKLYGLG